MLKKGSIDKKLIQLLQQNGRQSSNVLARQLGISSATVRRRLKKLVKGGLLRIVALVDPEKVGVPFVAFMALDVANDKMAEALKLLAARPEVTFVAATTGRFDIVIMAHFSTAAELSTFVRQQLANIEGIKDSETFLCLEIEKGRYQSYY